MLDKIKEMSTAVKVIIGLVVLVATTTVSFMKFFPSYFVTTEKHSAAVSELKDEIITVSNDAKLNTLKDLERELISDIVRLRKILQLDPNNEDNLRKLKKLENQLERVSQQIKELEDKQK